MSKLKQVNQSGYNKGYLAGRRDSADRIAELEAKLDAVNKLTEKWRKYTFDNPEATSYIDSADCADELEEALGEAK